MWATGSRCACPSRHFREATEPRATVGSHTVLLQVFEERIPILWEGRLGLPSLPPPSWLPPRLVPEKHSCTFSQAASGGGGWHSAALALAGEEQDRSPPHHPQPTGESETASPLGPGLLFSHHTRNSTIPARFLTVKASPWVEKVNFSAVK